MLWLIAVFGWVLIETYIVLQYRVLAKKLPKSAPLALALMYGLGVLPVTWVFALMYGIDLGSISIVALIWSLAAAGLFTIANILIFRAFAKVEAITYAVIHTLKFIAVLLVAFLIAGEQLDLGQLIGVVIILGAGLAMTVLTQRTSRKNRRKSILGYVLLLALASVISGVAQVSERMALVDISMANYIVISWTLQAILLVTVARPGKEQVKRLSKRGLVWPLVKIGVLRGLAGLCVVYAVAATQNVSLVSVVSATKVIFVALAGYIFLKERSQPYVKLGVTAVAMIGAFLLVR